MLEKLKRKIYDYHKPRRRAFSSKHPAFVPHIIFARRMARGMKNRATLGAKLRKAPFMPSVIARHSSLLYRKLGDTDEILQINKVQNLKLAIEKLNGIVILPHKTFSLWHQVGATNKKNGYIDGLVLSNGIPSTAVGGGLCQLSNFLFWILLHADVEIIERFHHSVDAFPDSGRTLPFGSGATIFNNYIDLKMKNISKHPLQIKLWLTDDCLKGQILSDAPSEKKFHIEEKNHTFIEHEGQYFRFNELYRETRIKGEKIGEEKIVENFAPVRYSVSPEYLTENSYNVIRI